MDQHIPLTGGTTEDADQEWLSAMYTTDGETVWAIIHNEYAGASHTDTVPGNCPSGDWLTCMNVSLALAVSTDGGATFEHVAEPPNHLIATMPYVYDPDGYGHGSASGLWQTSNILEGPDGYLYILVNVSGYPDASRETGENWVCAMRTDDISDPTSWRYWNGTDFSGEFFDPYVNDPGPPGSAEECAPVDFGALSGDMSESITWNEALQKYLIIGGTNDPTDPSSWGIFYSTSEDLINWTPRQLLHPFPIPAEGSAGLEPGHFLYGTLVDPSSESPTFDTTDDSFYIYGVIYNEGLDRDLVRYPVEIEQVALEPLAWNFDTDGDAEGWSPLFDLSAFTVGGGELSMVSESDDPYFGSESIRLSALYQTLTITMSVDGDGTDFGQVFFVAEDSNDFFDGDHIVDFEIIADGEPHTYEIDMGQNPNWSGMITQLRIDPSVYGDVEIRIDSITTS